MFIFEFYQNNMIWIIIDYFEIINLFRDSLYCNLNFGQSPLNSLWIL